MPQEQMNLRIKNFIGYAFGIALVVGAVSSLWYVYAFSRSIEPSSFRSFSVTGEGKAVTIPDIAQFTFQVISQGGTDLTDVQRINTQKTNNAIAFVKSKNIDEKDIKTQSYSLEPRYQYFNCRSRELNSEVAIPCPPPEIVGYTVRASVQVKIRDFEKIGELLSGVVQNGANSVSGIQFTVDDPTEVENKARAEAIVKAKEKAQAIAVAGSFRMGRLLSIQEGGGFSPVYQRSFAEGIGGDSMAVSAPVIEPGSQDFQVTMTLVYEIR
jgi:uncharacterized protein